MTLPLYLSYWIKMLLISVALMGYYWLFLRKYATHTFNRYYLLAAVFLALQLPLIRIPQLDYWADPVDQATATLTRPSPVLFRDIHTSPEKTYADFRANRDRLARYIYIVCSSIALALLWPLVRSLVVIRRLKRQYPASRVADIFVYVTPEAGTPFSFFNHLFWNETLSTETEKGQRIFRHELYHIRELHTLDILILETIRRLFWFNPLFYLALRELKGVHEFLADKYALESGLTGNPHSPITAEERSEYAEWLVWQSQGQTEVPRLVHSFYHAGLKDRIEKILYPTPAHAGYATRWLSLPLVIVLLMAFAATNNNRPHFKDYPGLHDARLTRFFLHNLRYPETALAEGKEANVWFDVIIDADGHKTGGSAGTRELGLRATAITVRSRPKDPAQQLSEAEDTANRAFLMEAMRVGDILYMDSAVSCPAGHYYFTVKFKIEK